MATPRHDGKTSALAAMTAIMVLFLGVAGVTKAGAAVFGDDLEKAAINAAAGAATDEAERALNAAGADAETVGQTTKLGGAVGSFWSLAWSKVKPFFAKLAAGTWHALQRAWSVITDATEKDAKPTATPPTNANDAAPVPTGTAQTP